MVSFKNVVKAGEHTPERFLEYPHVTLYDIQDKDVIIKDFELFTSSNKAKYDNDNEEGVIILVEFGGSLVTTVTHAKTIVRAFKNLSKRNMDMASFDEEYVQFHLGETTVNGKTFPQWQIL